MTKRKEERRELLKHDEFLTKMELAARYIQAHPRKVSMWVAVVVLVLAGIAGGINVYRGKQDQAAANLYNARNAFLRTADDANFDTKYETEKEKNEAALKELDELLASASGASRFQGLIYKASCLMELGQMDDAVSTYEELAKAPGEYGIMGLLGLGDLYVGREDYDKGLDYFRQVDGKSGKEFFEDIVKMRIATAQEKKGDLESETRT